MVAWNDFNANTKRRPWLAGGFNKAPARVVCYRLPFLRSTSPLSLPASSCSPIATRAVPPLPKSSPSSHLHTLCRTHPPSPESLPLPRGYIPHPVHYIYQPDLIIFTFKRPRFLADIGLAYHLYGLVLSVIKIQLLPPLSKKRFMSTRFGTLYVAYSARMASPTHPKGLAPPSVHVVSLPAVIRWGYVLHHIKSCPCDKIQGMQQFFVASSGEGRKKSEVGRT
jgi:hypothetical protein